MRRVLLVVVLCCGALRVAWAEDVDTQFRELLREDDGLSARAEQGTDARLESRLRRLDAKYRHFLSENPAHVRAMVAYGSFLYDQHREEEGVRWWERAVAADPRAAQAYNNLANHYAHNGHAADALRIYEKAFTLDPAEPMFRFNWATICVLFRNDTRQVYGWDTDEIFRRGLEQFRNARDLAPQDYAFSSGYAETFYMMKKPDWPEAYSAWKFCLDQPATDADRQRVYSHLARVCMRLGRYDEAQTWLARIDLPELGSLRNVLQRNLDQLVKDQPAASTSSQPVVGDTQ
jgi:tetratricopeptide (TPR) repeat protein